MRMAKKKQTYESAVARIEEIVFELENDQVPLEKSIDLYKEGMELTFFCKQTLETAEKGVMELKKTFNEKYTLSAFDESKEV